jgi:SAM-dependent methyltransferase
MYYRPDLSLVHHRGFGFHADLVGPGVLALLEPVRARNGLVLELGCGSGLLTKKLVDAGHRVLATDASIPMLDIARAELGDRDGIEFQQLTMPDDDMPEADAVVSVGHPISYLPTADAIERALVEMARCLRPGGVLAIDICDYEWGDVRKDQVGNGRIGDDWAVVVEWTVPSRDRFDRNITTFLANGDGTWRRDDEFHRNILVDTSKVPELLAQHGVDAEMRYAFGDETLPQGLRAIVGTKKV